MRSQQQPYRRTGRTVGFSQHSDHVGAGHRELEVVHSEHLAGMRLPERHVVLQQSSVVPRTEKSSAGIDRLSLLRTDLVGPPDSQMSAEIARRNGHGENQRMHQRMRSLV